MTAQDHATSCDKCKTLEHEKNEGPLDKASSARSEMCSEFVCNEYFTCRYAPWIPMIQVSSEIFDGSLLAWHRGVVFGLWCVLCGSFSVKDQIQVCDFRQACYWPICRLVPDFSALNAVRSSILRRLGMLRDGMFLVDDVCWVGYLLWFQSESKYEQRIV